VNTDHGWSAREMLAEDYRQLLGAPAGKAAPQENADVPAAADVPGLERWLIDVFGTTSSPSEPSPSPSPTSSPTPSPEPTASPQPSPTATPTSGKGGKAGGGGGRKG
jgi:hypothetical protein